MIKKKKKLAICETKMQPGFLKLFNTPLKIRLKGNWVDKLSLVSRYFFSDPESDVPTRFDCI